MKSWKQFSLILIVIMLVLIFTLNLYIRYFKQNKCPNKIKISKEGFENGSTNPTDSVYQDYPYGGMSLNDGLFLDPMNSSYTVDPSSSAIASFLQSKLPEPSGPQKDIPVNSVLAGYSPMVMPIYPNHDPKFDNPYAPKNGPKKSRYSPAEDISVQYSKLTGLSNSTPVYYMNDVGEGFCKFYKTNIIRLEEECNRLDKDTCASTSCCVLLGGDKCVYGDKTGAKMTANYTDPSISNRDRYYYMGKCYGNCDERKYRYEYPLVPSSHCSPPGVDSPKKHTYATPYLQDQIIQELVPKPIVDDQQNIYSQVDAPELIMKNGPTDVLPTQIT